ncbi:MAG: Smr/MutS family protein [Bacteroidota bacterium]
MLFANGSRVKFIHTGDEGKIIDQLSDGMLLVALDDGDEIPAFEEHLQRIGPTPKKPQPAPTPVPIPSSYPAPVLKKPPSEAIENPLGIQLIFEDVATTPGLQPDYRIYLLNDTVYSFVYTFELHTAGSVYTRVNDKLDGISAKVVGKMAYDQLNDQPKIVLDCWQVTTLGTGKKLSKVVKLKAKQFLKKIVYVPLLEKNVHHYLVFNEFEESITESEGEDLRSYTKRKVQPGRKQGNGYRSSVTDPGRFASFNNELDLHAERLTSDHSRMNSADILRLQIQHFDSFLHQAIRIGVKRVFIIHGLGKGRLRDVIASRLIRMREVETFRNEYHPKYGYGATEVIFQLQD